LETPLWENDLHIRVPAASFQAGWTELRGKNRGCLKAINGHLARGKPAVFWQTGQYVGVFSTGTQKKGYAGFSGIGSATKMGKWARIGLIFHQDNDPLHSRFPEKNQKRFLLFIPR
jgi:hypothetical protein